MGVTLNFVGLGWDLGSINGCWVGRVLVACWIGLGCLPLSLKRGGYGEEINLYVLLECEPRNSIMGISYIDVGS